MNKVKLNDLNKYFFFSNEQINKFDILLNKLIEFNKKINLTSIIKREEIIEKHFIDSILYGKILISNLNFEKINKILDIGTGAGFPGIPLAIMFPEKNFILVDSKLKKIHFVNQIIKFLKLKNVVTVCDRIEKLGQKIEYREKMDVVIARALAYLPILSEYSIPFIKKNGIVAVTKEYRTNEEIKKSKKAIKILGGKIIYIANYLLPKHKNKRIIIFIKKEKETPKIYPRKTGMPKKIPLI